MLDGTDPAQILCLTFTRAAAAEMANRINERLAKWTTCRSGALAQELAELTGRIPDDATIARARQLFARVLDTPGGIKIATIHAFCQSLLRRFPLEAGVPPEFAVIDERSAARSPGRSRRARDHRRRATTGTADLAEALASSRGYAPEERFVELMAALAAERGKLRQALADGRSGACAGRLVRGPVGVRQRDRRSPRRGFLRRGRRRRGRAARWLRRRWPTAPRTDRDRSATIAAGARPEQRPTACSTTTRGAFLTEQGEIRQTPDHQDGGARGRRTVPAGSLRPRPSGSKHFQGTRQPRRWSRRAAPWSRLGDALMDAYAERKRLQGCSITTTSWPRRWICCGGPGSRRGCCSSSMAGSTTS